LDNTLQSFPAFCYGRGTERTSDHGSNNNFSYGDGLLDHAGLGQSADKAIIARTGESISLAPLLYGIDKGYYRKEGVDLEFRILRTELAGAAMVGSWEVGQRSGRLPHLTRSGDRY
jgi:hypothetical protein